MSLSSPSSRRSTPKRRPLHQRTNSQNNVISPASSIRPISPTLRLVSNKTDYSEYDVDDDDVFSNPDDVDIYSANPYPTKAAHMLPPPGSSSARGRITRSGTPSTITPSDTWGSRASVSPDLESPSRSQQPTGSASDLSTVMGNTSSAIWGQDPKSSNTTVARSVTPQASESGYSGNGNDQEKSSDRSSVVVAPPGSVAATIKLINERERELSRSSQSPSSRSPPSDGSLRLDCAITRGRSTSSNASSNVARIGYTSSPNLVPLNSSSPNLLPIGSSPNVIRTRASESSLFSANSFGTAIRYIRNRGDQNTTSEPASVARSDSRTPSIPSSPPVPVLRSYPSTSTLDLNARSSQGNVSLPSMPSDIDIQAVMSSGVPMQYPILRPPSSSGSYAETSIVSIPEPLAVARPPTRRWNPELSSVSSDMSIPRDERHNLPSLSLDGTPDGSRQVTETEPSWLSARQQSEMPNYSLMDESEMDEVSDRITHLHALRVLKHKTSATLSYRSSLSRHGSLSRSGSTASQFLTTIPQWAKLYYQGGNLSFLSAVSLVEVSRPNTPRDMHAVTHVSYSEPLEEMSNKAVVRVPRGNISCPRTRPRRGSQPVQRQDQPQPQPQPARRQESAPIPEDEIQVEEPEPVQVEPKPKAIRRDSRDPRTHWAGIVGEDEITPEPSREDTPRAVWSPHLYTDKRFRSTERKVWRAPPYDESGEYIWSRRNMQVFSFCFGFIFPLAWLIASFLPLPMKPPSVDNGTPGQPDVEKATAHRAVLVDNLRYENARWWRNLNRCMTPVGLSIIVIVITLSVLGSRNAL
ncbi:hypothetical protein MGYG_06478 [Nannizzia gypsea CBS 118893]|uniref:Serine-rich protein n=1 Tax=Arthroderma gypseum (strain ATCC MYA-4604 / CBS 118893) TaxID=535722 RepID=E4UZE9_ARTGP|nr:hypothetical protein MGYG_06478 [Nannizzia gypsea CBS 118893]EFR03479.1 hypothetical protein MGYG_06478 [Nannizzia gypsea CBS 118893]